MFVYIGLTKCEHYCLEEYHKQHRMFGAITSTMNINSTEYYLFHLFCCCTIVLSEPKGRTSTTSNSGIRFFRILLFCFFVCATDASRDVRCTVWYKVCRRSFWSCDAGPGCAKLLQDCIDKTHRVVPQSTGSASHGVCPIKLSCTRSRVQVVANCRRSSMTTSCNNR